MLLICCLCFIVACSAPYLTLIPSTSNLSNPIQFRRNQDFFISSYIELNCNNSLTTNMKWTLNNCTNINCFNTIPMDSNVITTFSEIYIPALTLSLGIYELKLTVAMNSSSNLQTSKSVYIRITASGITANLAPLGTSMVTSGSKQDLELNPGLYSIDRDGYEFNASVKFDIDFIFNAIDYVI